MTELGLALLAGMLAAVNPCGVAMLPGYLGLVASGGSRLGRALAAAGLMTAGFVLVFGVFGLLSLPVLSLLQQWLPVLTVVIGLVMAVVGGLLLAGRELTLLLPKPARGAPTARLGSMFGYGVAFAVASLSCTIGPFLAVAGVALRDGGPLPFLAYALGMGLVVTVLAVAVAFSSEAGLRRVLPHVTRVGGALVLVAGLYVGYYGVHELRVAHAGADPADPVVDAAAAVQSALAGWVSALGPWPFVVALGVGLVALRFRKRPDKG